MKKWEIELLLADCDVCEHLDTPVALPSECEFTGRKAVFTGFSTVQKDAMLDVAHHCGITVQTTVCKSTELLVCGNNAGPSKLRRAMEQGVEILTAAQFFARLGTSCPAWAHDDRQTRPEDVEREMYVRFFQHQPISVLRDLYEAITDKSE